MYSYTRRSPVVSSRLNRNEQKKAIRQAIISIFLAISLILVFVFVVIPNFLKFIASKSQNPTTDISDTIPPQVPVIASPIDATKSAEIDFHGYAEAKSEVILLVNGNEQARSTAADDGTFSATASLSPGINTVTSYAIDQNKNESNSSSPLSITYDNEAPKLEITDPQADQQFQLTKNQVITVKGTTEPLAKITVNERLAFASSDGSFSTMYQLHDGDNLLTIQAEDKAGNVTKQELTVHFKP